jgi:hypothetical protein
VCTEWVGVREGSLQFGNIVPGVYTPVLAKYSGSATQTEYFVFACRKKSLPFLRQAVQPTAGRSPCSH